MTSPALAGPEGGVTIGGGATIEAVGPATIVRQSTDRAIIRWNSFDVQGHESVDFQQPSSSSITVNRILDSKASQIDGRITANGNIMLLNPNGIIFGAGSQVDVGGLVASASDLENDPDFLAGGNIKLTRPGDADSKIENHGMIRTAPGGLAGFVAPQVENHGIIQASLGRVTLASGDITTIDFAGDGLIKVEASDALNEQLVKNTGVLSADGGTVTMTAAAARDVITSLIDVSGYVGAQSVGDKEGRITIFAEGSNAVAGNIAANKGKKSGTSTVIIQDATLDVSGRNQGERGGDVMVMGDHIELYEGTTVDATGTNGGGSIFVGGGVHGSGLPTAATVRVSKGASLEANAIDSGMGGTIVTWADQLNMSAGRFLAKGGLNGGDGGFIETSAIGEVQFSESLLVDASSPLGLAGLWLIDPQDLVIDATGAGNIAATLNGGTSVTATTSACNASYGTCSGTTGNITVSSAIAKTSGANAALTLNADNNIILNAGISSTTGQLAVNLNATGNVSGNSSGTINTNGGLLTVNAGSGSGTLAGIISGSGALTKAGAGTLTLTGTNTYSGTTTVSAGTLQVGNGGTTGSLGSGSIVNNSDLTYSFGTTTSVATPLSYSGTGNLSLTGGVVWFPGNITVGGNLTINSTTNSASWLNLQTNVNPILTVGGTSSITGFLAGRSGGTNTLTLNSTGDITLNNITNGVIGNFWNWGTLNFNAGSNAINVTGTSVMSQNNLASTWNLTGASNITGNIAGTGSGTQTLNINAAGASTISGVLSSTIALTKSGTNTLTLSGANTYTGATTISAGTLQIGNGGTTGTLGTANVANNGILSFNRSDVLTVANAISGTGSMTQVGAGTAILTAANSYSGTTTISAGALQIGNNGTTGTLGSGALINNAALIFDRSNAVTVNNAISGTGSLTKLRANTLTLGGGKTYGGTTTVSAGTLQASSTSSFSANSAVTVASGATLDLAGWNNSIGSLAGAGTVTNSNAASPTLTAGSNNTSTTFSGVVQNSTGTMALTKSGTGTLTLSGTNTYTGATNVNAGTLQVLNTSAVSNVGVLGSGAVVVGSGAVLRYTNSRTANDTYLITNAISGAGSLLFDGPDGSITTLSNAETYTGGTTISSGVVNIGNNAVFGTGAVTMTGGAIRATLAARTLANAFNLNGTIGLGQSTNITGGITLSGNTNITCSANCGSSTFSGPVALGSHLLSTSDIGPNRLGATWSGQTLLLSGVVSGTGGITQGGAGTFTLSGANTYTGATTVSAGTLRAGIATSAFGNNSAVTLSSGATLNLSGFSNTIGSLAGTGGTVTNSSGTAVTLTNGGDGGSTSYAGIIQNGTGAVTLTKTGAGTLTLSGANTYTGGTNINAGILNVGSSGALSTSGTINFGGGTLQYSASNTTDYSGRFSAAGGQTRSIDTNGQSVTYASVLAGAGSALTKLGSGSLTLSGANTYTGATNVNAGTLALGANNVLADTGVLSVASGATFNLAGFTDTIASLTSVSGSTVALGNGTLTTSGAQSYGAQVTGGNVSLISSGGGAITANDTTNDFTGTLNISTAGAVSIVDANALTLGTVSGLTISARTLGAASDLTLGGNLNASATSGNSIILAAGRDVDNSGNRTLTTAGSARWQIYSGDTVNATQSVGSLSGYNRYGCTYNAGSPSCAAGTNIPASGNGFYYAFAPTLTITPTAIAALTYGDATPSLVGYGYGVGGYLGADSGLDTLSGSLTGSTLYAPTSNVGSHNVNYASGTLGSTLGYLFSYANNPTAITVNKASLLASANAQTITYGTIVPSSTVTYTGFVNSENDSVIDTLATLGSANSGIVNAGTYAGNYTASGALDNNYNFTYAAGNLLVNKALLLASANAQTITYGTIVPSSTVTYTGFVNSENDSVIDTLATLGSANSGIVNAGTYAGNYTASGALDNNYNFTYAAGNLLVNKASLLASANAQTITYGTIVPSSTVTYTGFVNSENDSVIDTLATLGSANSGIVNAGTYAGNYTASGALDNNYNFTYAVGNLLVNKASLLASANAQTITYGTIVPSSTVTYTGFVNSENDSVIDTLATLGSANSGIVNAGTYAGNYTASGALDNNYNFTYALGDLIVLAGSQNTLDDDFFIPSTVEQSLFNTSALLEIQYSDTNMLGFEVSERFKDIVVMEDAEIDSNLSTGKNFLLIIAQSVKNYFDLPSIDDSSSGVNTD